jgi:hypothetical protein
MNGRRYETKPANEETSNNIKKSRHVPLTISWEEYDKTSSVSKAKLSASLLQGQWTTNYGLYKDGEYNQPLNFNTPFVLEFEKKTLRRSAVEKFTPYNIINNIITVKNKDQKDIGFINKLTETELIITWKAYGNYTRYFYTRK